MRVGGTLPACRNKVYPPRGDLTATAGLIPIPPIPPQPCLGTLNQVNSRSAEPLVLIVCIFWARRAW